MRGSGKRRWFHDNVDRDEADGGAAGGADSNIFHDVAGGTVSGTVEFGFKWMGRRQQLSHAPLPATESSGSGAENTTGSTEDSIAADFDF